MRIQQLLENRELDPKDNFLEMMRNFLPLAMNIIGLKDLPKFTLVKKVPDAVQPTFGKYVDDESRIYLSIEDRHPIDILRTLAHELTHYKQGVDHKLGPDSGRTGSPEENEAHQVAGVVMRHFDKAFPQYFADKPLILEDWQKVNKHDKTDGLSRKAVNAYRREHPGSKLKTAVTTKPSKLKKGSKSAKRRKSFCARMSGMKKRRAGAKTKRDPNSPINKALRRWNCESIDEMQDLIILGEQYVHSLKESGSPAQQAAIAINMKKAGRKPKHASK
jgi:hypothetical protein